MCALGNWRDGGTHLLGPTSFSHFPSFVPQNFLVREQHGTDAASPLCPESLCFSQSSGLMTENSRLTDFFPPKVTESNGYLFIYLLIIYILSPSKQDVSPGIAS